MSKLIPEVDLIRKRVRLGYVEGVDAQSFRDIPMLLARINELETAMMPFVRLGNSIPSGELVYTYHKDCINAAVVMTPELPPKPIELPAE